jgi:NAD(P)H-hydrate repair Nnr-like enzyme with NAD(P)H-hydrate epimerase domain
LVDEHRLAARVTSGLDIAPTIPDHEAVVELDSVVGCGVEEHPRRRLPASTRVGVIVGTPSDVINVDMPSELEVESIEQAQGKRAPRNIGLVRNDNEHETGPPECRTGLGYSRENLKLDQG